MAVRRLLIILLTCLGLATAKAAHTQVTLILSADTARPGDTVLAGLDLKMDPGWHTYWKNPGESGIATTIKWDLPPGVTAGDIQWPLPKKLPPAEVTTYGYQDEVMLVVPLTLGPNLKAGQPLTLTANLRWLECQQQCIPGKTTVTATLNVNAEAKTSSSATVIAGWLQKVPGPLTNSGWSVQAYWEKSADGDSRSLMIEGQYLGSQNRPLVVESVDLFPGPNDNFEIQPAADQILDRSDVFRLRKIVKKYSGDWPQNISGDLVLSTTYGSFNFDLQLPVADQAPAKLAPANTTVPSTNSSVSGTAATSSPEPAQSLALMLFYAFLGGLILNIMPCVLPVIALKIFGFVSEAHGHPRRVRLLGLTYALGVILSFMVLAFFVIGIKAAGHRVGWGIQFGNPMFVISLATLVLLVALNLFGVFEVNMSGRALDAAGKLATQHGYSGAFFNGLLATILGTSCSAPFMGPALGFALAQNATVILLIFLMMGAGLAAPYVTLSWHPAWLKYLPKPGAWMEKFKIALGFPMLVTVVWLFTLAARIYGPSVVWLGIFLVLVAFAAWIFGEFIQRGRRRKILATVIMAALLIGGYAYALENQLHWREPVKISDYQPPSKVSADDIDWQKWSPEAVAAARRSGQPVLVDFTADWCVNCQVNKKTSIEIPSVRAKLKAINAVAMIADYTLGPDAITDELSRRGRAGVPLVLVFPKTPDAPAIVLPAVLTPNIVLDALDRASH